MENSQDRYGFVGVLLEEDSDKELVHKIISSNSNLILGRLGLPRVDGKGLSVITLIVHGTTDEIGSLTGKLGCLKGVSVKSGLQKKRVDE
ncbi:MAG: CopG family transcriptional regulator [Spirochaetales bacterium]|nr:CopG family transcriptional regulator [Spirochaetales bacterium]